MPIQRPSWLPSFIPELQGLRGLAVLGVVIYHCHPRLEGTWIYYASLWGWAGVNLFFVLSGFLITSILLEARDKPRYFRNFYGRRALRVWPLYMLILLVVYLNAPWFVGPSILGAVKAAPWLAYILFLQNFFYHALPPALVPTWSLAIEEQYYFLWAPLVLVLRRPWMLATVLFAALLGAPMLHHAHLPWVQSLNTLINLDGIALGSLLALGLHTLPFSRRVWLGFGLGAFVLGLAAAFTIAGGTVYLNTALATGFCGAVLAAIASSGARNPLSVLLRRGPLAFYGRISYGLYMTHITVFIFFGWVDLQINRYGIAGSVALVAIRLAASTAAAAGLWYGFESRILKLKRYF